MTCSLLPSLCCTFLLFLASEIRIPCFLVCYNRLYHTQAPAPGALPLQVQYSLSPNTALDFALLSDSAHHSAGAGLSTAYVDLQGGASLHAMV